ncbi:MAG: hypothetical protein KGI89_09975 [Euryarchaeota archaeon]|nr:hypothetical protein [Euryarchaeota archaeon]MDE2043907.1 hypothetical protein [Thermoplasmata archaeon]
MTYAVVDSLAVVRLLEGSLPSRALGTFRDAEEGVGASSSQRSHLPSSGGWSNTGGSVYGLPQVWRRSSRPYDRPGTW